MYVASPWNREYTFIPLDASVHMYCDAENALWSIHISTSVHDNFINFNIPSTKAVLNDNGIYEGVKGNSYNSEAIHLIVSSGSMNNETVIRCVAFTSNGDETVSETTLIVYGKKSDAIILLTTETIHVCISLITYHGHGCFIYN